MVTSKTGTNRHIGFESSRFCVDEEFGSSKRVVFVKLEQSVVVTTLIWFIKSIDTEVEVEEALSLDEDTRDGFLFQSNLLFLQPLDGYLLVTVHDGDINK